MFLLQGFNIGLASLQPRRPHSLKETCSKTFHIGALFGDKFVFWCVGFSYDKVGHIRGKIELVDRAHSFSDGGELSLFRGVKWLASNPRKGGLVAFSGLSMTLLTRCSGGIEVQHRMTPRRGVWWSAMFASGYPSMDAQCPFMTRAVYCSPQWRASAVLRDWWVRWARRVASIDNFTRISRDQLSMTSDVQNLRSSLF